MVHVVIKHGGQELALVALEGLDQEPVVMAKEEEAAAGACSLPRLENLILV